MFFGFSLHLQQRLHKQHSKDIIHLLDDTGACIAQDRNLTVDILLFVIKMYCVISDANRANKSASAMCRRKRPHRVGHIL
jgi:hypothetical protein